MDIIESLPNLTQLRGLSFETEDDDTMLDGIFKSCGATLQTLEITIDGHHMPRALLSKNRNLRDLSLFLCNTDPFNPAELIKLC